MNDEYAESAEFVDLLIGPFWTALGPVVTGALTGVTGTVVDLGAGSGQGTVLLAEALPDAEILAVEPSPGLRAALLAKVNADRGLRERVTVLPAAFPGVDLPERIGGLVAMNVLGHFDSAQRAALWSLLSGRLVSGGVAVVNLQPPSEPVHVPEAVASTARVGRLYYEGLARAEPAGDEAVTWHMTYRTYAGEGLVDERRVSYGWHLVTESVLRGETAEHDLALTAVGSPELTTFALRRG
ncbi:SAM-dependent methyltransferase [Prauserella isguenensis]|uniref:SAM-dependent methyltransferase n=1 Tax=Prauserella isguenensis TaxID=1470180 RepID=A0A839S453_9PSEU|nr:class I SAM-dependent methyltransferase [Prauserella isguenensis]MBB3051529.1 SAM-dependent methyltransferase [Prauserella isguenensis]